MVRRRGGHGVQKIMQAWTVFDKATGRIRQAAFGAGLISPGEDDSKGVVPLRGDPRIHYVCPITLQLKSLPNPNIKS